MTKHQPSHTKALEDTRVYLALKEAGPSTPTNLHNIIGGSRRMITRRLIRMHKTGLINGKQTDRLWLFWPKPQSAEE